MYNFKPPAKSPLMQRVEQTQKRNSLTVQIAESTIMFSIGVGVGVIFYTVVLLKFGC